MQLRPQFDDVSLFIGPGMDALYVDPVESALNIFLADPVLKEAVQTYKLISDSKWQTFQRMVLNYARCEHCVETSEVAVYLNSLSEEHLSEYFELLRQNEAQKLLECGAAGLMLLDKRWDDLVHLRGTP